MVKFFRPDVRRIQQTRVFCTNLGGSQQNILCDRIFDKQRFLFNLKDIRTSLLLFQGKQSTTPTSAPPYGLPSE